ncbi:biotin/lipoyl-binding protein [Iningainema tapete]|uniref:Biotin/lipoyl-binding protein n=1 Tax=Iningainema tapete BLCC-T55 TaxID=2748662 RepID=A0A8J7BZC4_9CYAN|nr:biotin/lipoyl-binding protein [Iningainema tapete BLCC-T55]
MNFEFLSKPGNIRLIGLVVAATAIASGIILYSFSHKITSHSTVPMPTKPTVKKVTALGRLEPEAEVIRLSAPLALDGDVWRQAAPRLRISQILVKEGSRVKAGQVLAILDSPKRLQDALQQAQKQMIVAQAKLAPVKAGAKTGEIQAQQSTITRLQAELTGEIKTRNAAIARWQSEANNALC